SGIRAVIPAGAGDGLSVSCAGSRPGEAEFFLRAALRCEGAGGNPRNHAGGSDPGDGGERQEIVPFTGGEIWQRSWETRSRPLRSYKSTALCAKKSLDRIF